MLAFLAVVLPACSEDSEEVYEPRFSEEAPVDGTVYVFGIHPLHNPKRLHEIFGPVAAYLSRHLDGARIKIEASRNYAAYDAKLYARKFHFSLPNPFQTVNALKHGYRVFGKMADDENFRGIILVRKDAGVRNVLDLKGKAVSFPAPTALAATMMPQYFLQSRGLNVMKDIEVRYVGSQESSMMNVQLGHTVAGATWPPPWRAFAAERPELARDLEVKWQTEPLPNNGLIVRDDVPAAVTDKVARLLFALHETADGKAMLDRMALSRFEPADNATYDPVVAFLGKFSATVRPVE